MSLFRQFANVGRGPGVEPIMRLYSLLFVLALIIAACGGESVDPSADGTTTTLEDPTTSEDSTTTTAVPPTTIDPDADIDR